MASVAASDSGMRGATAAHAEMVGLEALLDLLGPLWASATRMSPTWNTLIACPGCAEELARGATGGPGGLPQITHVLSKGGAMDAPRFYVRFYRRERKGPRASSQSYW